MMFNAPFVKHARGDRRRILCFAALLAAGLAGLSITPAVADDDDHDRGRGHGRGHDRHEQRGDGHWDGYRHREWRARDYGYSYQPAYPQPYLYSQPVYVPPPVYYAPRQSPGISLFFPLDLR